MGEALVVRRGGGNTGKFCYSTQQYQFDVVRTQIYEVSMGGGNYVKYSDTLVPSATGTVSLPENCATFSIYEGSQQAFIQTVKGKYVQFQNHPDNVGLCIDAYTDTYGQLCAQVQETKTTILSKLFTVSSSQKKAGTSNDDKYIYTAL